MNGVFLSNRVRSLINVPVNFSRQELLKMNDGERATVDAIYYEAETRGDAGGEYLLECFTPGQVLALGPRECDRLMDHAQEEQEHYEEMQRLHPVGNPYMESMKATDQLSI